MPVAESNLTPERRAWLHSLGIDSTMIKSYRLDRPMPYDGWIVLVREVIRYSATMRKGHSARDPITGGQFSSCPPSNKPSRNP